MPRHFPPTCARISIDLVRAGRQGRTSPDQARQITAAIEIKGTAGLQRIPLEIRSDWIPVEQTIDWPAIGTVKEVVVLVNSISDREPATGTILIDARFERLSRAPASQPVIGGHDSAASSWQA